MRSRRQQPRFISAQQHVHPDAPALAFPRPVHTHMCAHAYTVMQTERQVHVARSCLYHLLQRQPPLSVRADQPPKNSSGLTLFPVRLAALFRGRCARVVVRVHRRDRVEGCGPVGGQSLFSLTLSDIHAWLTDLHSYVDKASEVSHWSNPSLSQVNRPKHTHAHCHRRICDVCLQAQWSDCILIAGISPRAGGSKTRSRGIWLRKIRVTPSCLYRFGGGGTLILRSQILRTRVLDSPPVGNSCYQFAHVKHRLVELPPSAEVFTDLCSLKLPRKPMPAHSGGVGVLHLVELKGQTAALLASQSGPLFH